MSAIALLPLMISSFQCVQSYTIIQYAKASKAYWDNDTHKCVTEWGNFSAGRVVHVYKFHGKAYLVCKYGELRFDMNSSYVKMYGASIPAGGNHILTNCGVISYRIITDRPNDRETLSIKFQVDMDERSSPTVCIIKEFKSCSNVGETRHDIKCALFRCTELGEFKYFRQDCEDLGKCYLQKTTFIYVVVNAPLRCHCGTDAKIKCDRT